MISESLYCILHKILLDLAFSLQSTIQKFIKVMLDFEPNVILSHTCQSRTVKSCYLVSFIGTQTRTMYEETKLLNVLRMTHKDTNVLKGV